MAESTITTDPIQQEIIEEFSYFDDWLDKYQYIIDLGRQLAALPDTEVTDQNRLEGCQSNVWMLFDSDCDDTVAIRANSDSTIVSGLIALLIRVYSGRTKAEILTTEPYFINAIGLQAHLSPTRSNGLHAMLQAIMQFASR